jgi:hypothetical protein
VTGGNSYAERLLPDRKRRISNRIGSSMSRFGITTADIVFEGPKGIELEAIHSPGMNRRRNCTSHGANTDRDG